MVISVPQHAQCSNLAEARWVQYTCNHENNVPSRLSRQWLCGNSCATQLTIYIYIVYIYIMYDIYIHCIYIYIIHYIYTYICFYIYNIYIYIIYLQLFSPGISQIKIVSPSLTEPELYQHQTINTNLLLALFIVRDRAIFDSSMKRGSMQ